MVVEMNEKTTELIAKIRNRIESDTKLIEELMPKEELAMIETYAEVEKRVDAKPNEPKYATDVDWLDNNLNGGFTRGSYVNLAGVSFSGKSTLAMRILSNISAYHKAVFFSFEMYENILVQELRHLTGVQKKNMLIVQKGYDIDMVEKIIREQSKNGVVFFAIDSKMKIKTNFGGKEYQEISKLSSMLARLTQELGIILLLINQINEEDRKNGKFGLKGSGDQIYDSDVVLYIDVKVDEKTQKEERWCFCAKDRYNKKKWKENITMPDIEIMPVQTIEYSEDFKQEKPIIGLPKL